MTRRTFQSDAGPIEVFETGLGLQHWAKRTKHDCIAIARRKFYFQRKNGFEMTVRLTATDCPQNRHIVAAANAVAAEVEAALLPEKAVA